MCDKGSFHRYLTTFSVLFLTKGVEDGKGQSPTIELLDLQVMTLLLGQSWCSKASYELC